MKKYINIFISVLLLASCSKTPSDQIINYTEEKYGANFKEENIDLSKVFGFKWQTLYIFSPLMYPENIEKEIGFKYNGQVVKDNNYLFLFIDENKIIKEYTYSDIKIGFSDNTNTGVYKISFEKSKYRIKKIGTNNYWLYKDK